MPGEPGPTSLTLVQCSPLAARRACRLYDPWERQMIDLDHRELVMAHQATRRAEAEAYRRTSCSDHHSLQDRVSSPVARAWHWMWPRLQAFLTLPMRHGVPSRITRRAGPHPYHGPPTRKRSRALTLQGPSVKRGATGHGDGTCPTQTAR